MSWFFYYIGHSFVNQIRKLLKTWVLIFLVACIVLGLVFGTAVGLIADSFSDESAEEQDGGEVGEEVADPEEEIFGLTLTDEEAHGLVELVAFGVILLIFVLHILWADKSGNAIFLPADVNLLFAAPMKPQTVLIFRLLTQLGAFVFLTLYFFFQIRRLAMMLSLSALGVIALFVAWLLLLAMAKILQTLIYTV